ncbi:hypothetical protein COCMIDRAFT_34139 [Bipolaris oryzae ATCC 44560]|uniref:Uncharacterized protein n=1 Tax=Bipolaris oryzae ATCC 44560 TaxID=930090 RepID=W6ZF03_COCMI|nr:uncharacterized protein COCMIDRAFT_34139 [Bipolaris oryzae ATCC 44560]EUC48458.1 hypothetical protein COCMIDRAFT_34139 [Bipolaris oryzae ATCC 44560]
MYWEKSYARRRADRLPVLVTAPLPNDNGPLGRRTLSGHSCALCGGARHPPVSQGLDGTSSVLTRHVPIQAVQAEITRPLLLSLLYTSGPPGPDAERLDRPRPPQGPDSTRYGSSSRAGNHKRHQPSTWHLRAFTYASRRQWGVPSNSSQRMAVENRLTLWIMTTI